MDFAPTMSRAITKNELSVRFETWIAASGFIRIPKESGLRRCEYEVIGHASRYSVAMTCFHSCITLRSVEAAIGRRQLERVVRPLMFVPFGKADTELCTEAPAPAMMLFPSSG